MARDIIVSIATETANARDFMEILQPWAPGHPQLLPTPAVPKSFRQVKGFCGWPGRKPSSLRPLYAWRHPDQQKISDLLKTVHYLRPQVRRRRFSAIRIPPPA